MKEENENYACELDLKGGYHGRPYSQKFVKAPLSQHPDCPNNYSKETDHEKVMRMVLGK